VLKWDAKIEEKGKQRKFYSLLKGHYKSEALHGTTAFLFKDLIGESLIGGPINGGLLKHYFILIQLV